MVPMRAHSSSVACPAEPCSFRGLASATFFVLLLVGLLAGCGQGGGGGGTSPSAPPGTPPPVSANLAPEIISAPVLFAAPNTPYTYEVFAVDPNSEPVSYSLPSAPQGMTINASTGEITWTPTSQQSGAHTVQVAASDGQRAGAQSFTVTVEKHTTLASATIGSAGGTLTVPATSPLFAGLSVTVPAGELAKESTVTLRAVQDPVSNAVAAFSVGIHTNPLPTQSVSLLSLMGFGWLADVAAAAAVPSQTLNSVAGVIRVPQLSVFTETDQAVLITRGSGTAGTTPMVWDQTSGPLNSFVSSIGIGIDRATSFVAGMVKKAADASGAFVIESFLPNVPIVGSVLDLPMALQPDELIPIKPEGDLDAFFKQPGRKLLLLHGTGSSMSGFVGPCDWVVPASISCEASHLLSISGQFPQEPLRLYPGFNSRYDHVFFYNYPSGRPIQENGNALCGDILLQEKKAGKKLTDLAPDGIDIVAHSMGGLVARWLIEKSPCSQAKLGRRLVGTLVMVGTPNEGVLDVWLGKFLANFGSFFLLVTGTGIENGAEALRTNSLFLLDLNDQQRSPITNPAKKINHGSTRYGLITADGGINALVGKDDGVVPLHTPDLVKFLDIKTGDEVPLDPDSDRTHIDLHEKCQDNGVCAIIEKILDRQPLPVTPPPQPGSEPPKPPASFQATPATSSASASTVLLTWLPPPGAQGKLTYKIERDGVLVGMTDRTSFTDREAVPGRDYTYRIVAIDQANRPSTPIEKRVTTPAFVDTTPPKITSLFGSDVTSTSAVIHWFTDEPADSQVEYGTSAALGFRSPLIASRTQSHVVILTGLSADTTYSYRVRSRDAAGNEGISAIKTFKTAARAADFDFSLTPAQASITVEAGKSATVALTLRLTKGQAQAVGLTCGGLPTGASCSFSPSTVMPTQAGAPTTLTIRTIATTPTGSSSVTVTGNGGGIGRSAPTPITLIVTAATTLTVNGVLNNYSTSTTPYTQLINLTGSGFNSVTEIRWTCTLPSGASCTGSPYVWNASNNWLGKFTRTSDGTVATVSPTFLTGATGEPTGPYAWTVTFSGAGPPVTRTFTVANNTAGAGTLVVNGFAPSYSTSTTPYAPRIDLTGSGFTSITQVSWTCTMPNGTSCTGSPYIWTSANNWNGGKFTQPTDTSVSVFPTLLTGATGEPTGTYFWSVTFSGAGQLVTKTFTVNYTPTTSLNFTSPSLGTIPVSTVGYQPTLTASGNVTQVTFSRSGANNGSEIWNKNDANWLSKVTANPDGSITLRPIVTKASDAPGVTNWTVTIKDSTGATRSQNFSVNYQPTSTTAAPTLTVPANNATGQSLTPTLQWSGGAATYWQVNIRNMSTNALHTSAALPSSQQSYTVSSGVLQAGVQYRWDVTACPNTACLSGYQTSGNAFFTTAAGGGSGSGQVRVLYVIPQDRALRTDYNGAVQSAMVDVQSWYRDQLGGKTFTLSASQPEVCHLPQAAAYYASDSWNKVLNDVQGCALVSNNSSVFAWVLYVDIIHACNAPGRLGAGGNGITMMPRQDLDGLIGVPIIDDCGVPYNQPPSRYVGGAGHELGHALGLNHPPGCDAGLAICDQNATNSLMYIGYSAYPNTYLLPADKQILFASLFIK